MEFLEFFFLFNIIVQLFLYKSVFFPHRLNPFNSESVSAKGNNVEVASEMCEEVDFKTNMSSPSEPSEASTWRRRDLVSMVTFRLSTLELIRQNRGPLSAIRVQVAAVSCDECGSIPWDEFQASGCYTISKTIFIFLSH